ncbi:hypothetical protein BGZ98_003100, partial [Dissophora globulifera]
MLRTIKEYYCTEQDEDYDWVYGNARDGRDLGTTLASSPNVSLGPSEVTIFLPLEESSSVPSPEPIQTVDGDDVVDRL